MRVNYVGKVTMGAHWLENRVAGVRNRIGSLRTSEREVVGLELKDQKVLVIRRLFTLGFHGLFPFYYDLLFFYVFGKSGFRHSHLG